MTHGNGLGVLQFIHEFLNGHWETNSPNFSIGELENYFSNNTETTLTIKSKLWLEPYDMRVSQYVKIDFIKEKDERVFKIVYFKVKML